MPDNTYIIAEIGINHNGDIDLAKKLIDTAAEAGCNAVKFQKRTIDIVYTKETLDGPRESPWGTTQREQKEGLEFNKEEYDIINDYCQSKNIQWSASAWDVESQLFLRQYDLPFNKVASAMITHEPLLNTIASEGLHTYISTGMSTYREIDKAVEIFENHGCSYTLLHCVSTYPTTESDSNVSVIHALKDRYNCTVGYSGHEEEWLPTITAVAAGATVVERHITMDKGMYGSDQSASLEPEQIKDLVTTIRRVEEILGDGNKTILEEEIPISNKLRYW